MTPGEVRETFWRLAAPHMPLRLYRDSVYVSPEAFDVLLYVVSDLFSSQTLMADPKLKGLEMRLQIDC